MIELYKKGLRNRLLPIDRCCKGFGRQLTAGLSHVESLQITRWSQDPTVKPFQVKKRAKQPSALEVSPIYIALEPRRDLER